MKYEKIIMDCVKNESTQKQQESCQGEFVATETVSTSIDTEDIDMGQMFLDIDRELQALEMQRVSATKNDAMDVFSKIIKLDLDTLNTRNLKLGKKTG